MTGRAGPGTTRAMKPSDVRALLERVRAGEASVDAAARALVELPFESLGFATVDHHRALRTGFPEVVYGAGKTVEQIAAIVGRIADRGQNALVTRVAPEDAARVVERLAPAHAARAEVSAVARMLVVGERPAPRGRGTVAVVSAGTSDAAPFEEAALTAEWLGNRVERIQDVGVAGLHRLLAVRDRLESAEVIVAVAGFEGALPSVLAGLVSRPVIAVPTSVGEGASFGGLAALLAMLNSCASGVTVVNIDNGFGAGYAAALINRSNESAETP